MSNQNVQTAPNKSVDMLIVTAAIVVAVAGLLCFTFMTEQNLGIRLAALLGGLAVAVGIAALSSSGKRFIAFGRESYEELRRVVWPTRKETINTTGLVMAFVVIVAFYLFIVDKLVELGLYDFLLKISF